VNEKITPFEPIGKLFLMMPDTEFSKFCIEINKLWEYEPEIGVHIQRDLDLYIVSEIVGQGLPLLTPKGTAIKREIEGFVTEEEIKRGYEYTSTPIMAKSDLYKGYLMRRAFAGKRVFGGFLVLMISAAVCSGVTSTITRHGTAGVLLKGETDKTTISSEGTITLSRATQRLDLGDYLDNVWAISLVASLAPNCISSGLR